MNALPDHEHATIEDGKTKGPLEGLRPEQIEVVPSGEAGLRFSSVDLDDDGTLCTRLLLLNIGDEPATTRRKT